MFWVVSVGLTSASPQANTSEQTLKKQRFTPSQRATVCGTISERDSEYRGENALLCIQDDFSAKFSINAPLSELMSSVREGKSAAFLSGKNRYDFRGICHAALQICDTAEFKVLSVSSATPQKWFLSVIFVFTRLTYILFPLHFLSFSLHFSFILKYFVIPRSVKM